ncbi:hypothetical protein WBP06_14350 [Novosphingobium sp. BL-8H]|uniref:hypothetical protein n=1 Tax=Novosphingobium sp. BL-8H TaxID=3127640 RepID=UPI003756D881
MSRHVRKLSGTRIRGHAERPNGIAARDYSRYAEGGYVGNDSTVPPRADHGFIGQPGLHWNVLLAQGC